MMRTRRQYGVTLIELVIVIVVVGVVAASFSSGFKTVSKALLANDPLQRGASFAEECAEHILHVYRDPAQGYGSVSGASCAGLPASAGLTRNVSVDTAYTPGIGICPAGATACKSVNISVTSGGLTVGQLDLMLFAD